MRCALERVCASHSPFTLEPLANGGFHRGYVRKIAAQRVCLARRWVLVRHGSTTAREVVVSCAAETVRHLVTHVGGSVLAAGAPTTMVSSAISRSEQSPRRRTGPLPKRLDRKSVV